MDVLEAIRNRRSIRQYKSDPVDDQTVNTVLEAAHWAPSWGNTQCWRFVVVHDSKIKSGLAGTLLRVKVDNEWVENAAAKSISQVPVVIVLCAELGKAGFRSDGSPDIDKREWWFMFDVALAMENLVLAAHSLGLGTVIIGGFDAKKAADILEVPPELSVVSMTPLGYPDHKGQVSPRKDLSEVIYKEKYGK